LIPTSARSFKPASSASVSSAVKVFVADIGFVFAVAPDELKIFPMFSSSPFAIASLIRAAASLLVIETGSSALIAFKASGVNAFSVSFIPARCIRRMSASRSEIAASGIFVFGLVEAAAAAAASESAAMVSFVSRIPASRSSILSRTHCWK